MTEGNRVTRTFTTYIFQQLLLGLQITEGEMVGTCSLYMGKENFMQVFVGDIWKKILVGRPRHRGELTLTLLTWTKWWARASASKWRMGFNSAFKGLILECTFKK